MIVKCMLPLSIVEKDAFKNYISQLDPSFVMPSRRTMKESGVPQLKDSVNVKVKNLLVTIDHPNITNDWWTDQTMRSFNGYLVHGIDKNWELRVIPIAFRPINGKCIFVFSVFLSF